MDLQEGGLIPIHGLGGEAESHHVQVGVGGSGRSGDGRPWLEVVSHVGRLPGEVGYGGEGRGGGWRRLGFEPGVPG